MTPSSKILLLVAAVAGSGMLMSTATSSTRERWTAEERTMLASMGLASLEPLVPDPSNRYADDPAAARFGRALFFDSLLSANGKVACATCHLPARDFQDDRPLGHGVGVTGRRTMPIAGTAYSPWLFWDGRTDSQWSQALGPLESAVEHGGDRTQYATYIAKYQRDEYERVFGRMPDVSGLPSHAGPHGTAVARAAWSALKPEQRDAVDQIFVNVGKAIAAFERGISFGETRFDRYVAAELAGVSPAPADRFSDDEEAGLRLFIGKASCINCHNGPRLTDDHFHNTGVAPAPGVTEVDSGRTTGVRQVVSGEFNCMSKHSDARPEQCAELRFAATEGRELVRAFKTPSLRNVADRAPYMHAGQIASLGDVIRHYDRAPRASFGSSELKKLRLSAQERLQLEAFLRTLSAPPIVK